MSNKPNDKPEKDNAEKNKIASTGIEAGTNLLPSTQEMAKHYKIYATPEASHDLPGPQFLASSSSPKKFLLHADNLPKVTGGLQSWQDVREFLSGLSAEPLAYLSKPDAVNQSLLQIGPALDTAVNYYAQKISTGDGNGFGKDVNDFSRAIAIGTAEEVEKLKKPQTPKETGVQVAALAPFFFGGEGFKVLRADVVKEMGLATKTAEELEKLKIKRFDMPRLTLTRDDFSFKAGITSDSKAFVRFTSPSPGIVEVTDVFKGNLPDGTGSSFLAEALKGHGCIPKDKMILAGVCNPETLEAFKAGVDPANSLLGRMAANTLKLLGKEATSYEYQVARGKLNIVINLKR